MSRLGNLIYNEMLKLVRKKRLVVIMLVIVVLASLFTYAQYKSAVSIQKKVGSTDWHTQLQQQIVDTENRLSSHGGDSWDNYLKIKVQQDQYYLNHNINPTTSDAVSFARNFIEEAISLLLPLLVMVVASDIVSSERSEGTIKLLLSRPVKRWRILLSKYLTLILAVSVVIVGAIVISYGVSGIVLGYGGWYKPVIGGFSIQNNQLITTNAHLIPQWSFLLMDAGLAWFVCLVVATLTFMLSVLIRATAAVMGIMLAFLIAGAILANMVSSWASAKYFFMVNMNLTHYINGISPPIQGMTLGFSMTVLLLWGIAGLLISFFNFTRKDIY